MARLNVNPTRMELTKLKKRLATARRGHKLLKDKRDELMKRFIELIKQNQELRLGMEQKAADCSRAFVMAGAVTSPEELSQALAYPSCSVEVQVSDKNIMGVTVPEFTYSVTLCVARPTQVQPCFTLRHLFFTEVHFPTSDIVLHAGQKLLYALDTLIRHICQTES